MIKLADVLVQGKRGERFSLSKLVGDKTIEDVHGYLSGELGGIGFKLTQIKFTDGTWLNVNGEHDFPFVTGDQPNFDEETFARLAAEDEARY